MLALGLIGGCAEGFEEGSTQSANRLGESAQIDRFNPPVEIDHDGLTADIEPVFVVAINNIATARELFVDGMAQFEYPEPFQQVSWMMDSDDVSELAFRAVGADGQWTSWEPVEITWNEGRAYNALIRLAQPTTLLEMRGGQHIEEAELEFYPIVMAREEFLTAKEEALIDEPSIELRSDGLRSVQQASVAPSSLVISRSGWGAINPSKLCGSVVAPYRTTVHHTAVPSNDGGDAAARMRQMQSYHINNLKWCDIGYHFVIAQTGKIYQGRSRSDRPGAHTLNTNAGNVGISFIANFVEQTPTNTQLDAGARITKWINATHGVALTRTAFKGHREWPGQSTACPGTSMINRLQTILDRAKGAAPPPPPPPPPPPAPTYKVDVKVNWIGLDNFYSQGSSAAIADALVGKTFKAEIIVHNQSSDPIRGVKLGYFVEQPFIRATNYAIQTDHPAKDRKTWVTNDANGAPENPAKDALGKEGTLTMYAFGAGESKRVLIDVEALRYSIGQADHPDVRGWIKTITDVYQQNGYFDAPTVNKASGVLRNFAQMDVVSTQEWQFNSKKHDDDLEGWTGAGAAHFDKLAHNKTHGMLAMHVTGNDARVVSPTWTKLDANAFDQLVLAARSHDGDHIKAIYWAREGESFSEDRVVRFEAPGNSEVQNLVVPMSKHALWSGSITRLRIDLIDDRGPAEGDSGWYDVGSIFFQSSTNNKTSSANLAFEPSAPVRLTLEDEILDETDVPVVKPGHDDNNNPGHDDNNKPGVDPDPKLPRHDDTVVPPADIDELGPATDHSMGDKPKGVAINAGCSATGTAPIDGSGKTLLFMGLGLLAMMLVRRK